MSTAKGKARGKWVIVGCRLDPDGGMSAVKVWRPAKPHRRAR